MATFHEPSTATSSPILPCCAAHLGIDEIGQPLDIANDGASDQPGISNKKLMFYMEQEEFKRRQENKSKKAQQVTDTTTATEFSPKHVGPENDSGSGEHRGINRAIHKDRAALPYKKAARAQRKEGGNLSQEAATETSNPVQGDNPSSKKSAFKSATKKASPQTQSKAEHSLRGQGRNASSDNSSDDNPSDVSPDNSSNDDDDKPNAKKSALKSATNRSARKTATNKVSPQTQSKAEDHSQARKDNSSSRNGRAVCPDGNDDQIPSRATLQFAKPQGNRNNTSSEFVSIALEGYRRLQFCGFSDNLASRLGNEIAQFGGKGVSKERPWGVGYEFKLRGDPWGYLKDEFISLATERAVGKRILGDGGATKEEIFLRHMFRVMHLNGYSLHLFNQSVEHIGTFFFKKSPNLPKGTAEFMTISFHTPTRLRLTGAPQEFIEAVQKLLQEKGRFKGERKKTQKPKKGRPKATEFKVPGHSWNSWHHWFTYAREKRMKVTKGRVLKADLMKLLENQGWKPVISADPGARKGKDQHVVTTWYYYRDRDTLREKGLELDQASGAPQKTDIWSKITGR